MLWESPFQNEFRFEQNLTQCLLEATGLHVVTLFSWTLESLSSSGFKFRLCLGLLRLILAAGTFQYFLSLLCLQHEERFDC